MSEAAERILYLLKSRGAMATRLVARHLGITEAGARQHLAKLVADELVDHVDEAGRVGRPRRLWRLAAKGHARFPDSHADLTASLIAATRRLFGEDGLDRLIRTREAEQLARYRAAIGAGALGARVRALARLRAEEGYMAEVKTPRDGSFLLIENHCPICVAAQACQGFCRSELSLFQAALGPGVTVERRDHLLDGARRCVYRIAAT